MRLILLSTLLLFTACQQKPTVQKNLEEVYPCTVRVNMKWKEELIRKQRDNVILEYNRETIINDNAKHHYSYGLNRNDELIHFLLKDKNGNNCQDKYERIQLSLDKYLKPLKNAPIYTIYRKTLKKDEFDGLDVKISKIK